MLPIHSRILRISKTGEKKGGSEPVFQVAYGVPWTIETFIAEAINRGHPVNLFDGLATSLQTAIDANASWDPDKIILHRSRWLKRWTTRALELSDQERELHAQTPQAPEGHPTWEKIPGLEGDARRDALPGSWNS